MDARVILAGTCIGIVGVWGLAVIVGVIVTGRPLAETGASVLTSIGDALIVGAFGLLAAGRGESKP